ncbi:metallophosphoesterase [Archangium sp.]|uniref:metallophosphoesterase n=1 Tax=Archangium sp. TaxID=1872627 RepID=UPI00389AD48E
MGFRGSRLVISEHREAFEQDLRKMHARTGPWDLVFISGDLTLTGSARDFSLLNSTLSSLWEFLRVLGSDPCLMVVPGPHDLWQKPPFVADLLKGWDLGRGLREAESRQLAQDVERALAPFNDWSSAWQQTHSSPLLRKFRPGLHPGDFVATVGKQELTIGVVGLNSLFNLPASTQDTQQAGRDTVMAATGVSARKWAFHHDLVLVLTHHAPSLLHASQVTQFHRNLAPPGSLLLHLCGGRNREDWVKTFDPPHRAHTVQALSLFGGSKDDSGALPLFSGAASASMVHGRWGYTVGEIDVSASRGRLKLFPRVVSFSKGVPSLVPDARWVSDSSESFERLFAGLKGLSDASENKPGAPKPAEARKPVKDAPREGESPSELREVEWTPKVRPPPPGVKPLDFLLTGSELVNGMAWAPAGDALAMGLSTGELLCWEPGAGDGVARWRSKAHATAIMEVCFSPDGQMLASRSRNAIHLWLVDGARSNTFETLAGSKGVSAWSSTGLLAIHDEQGGSVRFWDARSRAWVDSSPLPATVLYCMAWSPDGRMLACGGVGKDALSLYVVQQGYPVLAIRLGPPWEHHVDILGIAWMPDSSRFAMACRDRNIYVVDTREGSQGLVLEGHTGAVTSVSFSFDGRLLASKSTDGTVCLWRTDTWEQVAVLAEATSGLSEAGLAFSPTAHVLASVRPGKRGVQLWELDVGALLGAKAPSKTVHEVSAKVVLVGEGRVGKSCLALRMGKDRYEELDPTHGMQFWSLPAEQPDPGGVAAAVRRDIILWDMGGQSEYQLVHQLFLRDSTVALMVMEPGRGESALEEIEGWNQRLLAQSGGRSIRKLLVGTKVDSALSPVNLPAIEERLQRLQFDAYVSTSAKTGQGIASLKAALARAIDWDNLEKVSRPELFQRLRQHIQRLREARRVVLTFSELEGELRAEAGESFDPEALRAVVGHLSRQGLVADTRMADGTRVLILEIEQVERYAGSLIIAARDNPHGVPAIDLAKVMSSSMRFPRLPPEERLRRDQELAVLDCVIGLLLEHGLCLRHEGLLIFPSLFQPTQPEMGTSFPYAISLHYDFSGPIDNIYASLITSLAISQRFGSMRLWEDRAEFGRAGGETSGVRRVQSRGQSARGYARLEVYFDTSTMAATRELFVNFIEQHLREKGVELQERLTLTCACARVFEEDVVRERLSAGLLDIGCPACDRRTPLTPGAQQSRELNPELMNQLQALRIIVYEQRAEDVIDTKIDLTKAKEEAPSQDPIRILHLSDLHIGAGDDPLSLLQPLMADLQDRHEGLGVERLDYLVISGDITNRASPQEFEKAREFVSGLIKEFGLTAERCIIVPGNHDLDWDTEVYDWKKKRHVDVSTLARGSFREAGEDGYRIRDDAKYPERFKNFSQYFYHPLTQRAYPFAPEEQCLSFLFSDSRLQFLAMNSAWEIDEYFRERSGISEKALSRGLAAAEQDVRKAREGSELADGAKVLRLAVWHHPITGNEKMQDDAFVARLLQKDVRVCLHGHVHEDRVDLVNHVHSERRLHVVGAGSFGAPTRERPESTPRLFNLLEVQRDLQRVRVHTRCLRKHGGVWEGWAVWPGEKPGERRTYYDMTLP